MRWRGPPGGPTPLPVRPRGRHFKPPTAARVGDSRKYQETPNAGAIERALHRRQPIRGREWELRLWVGQSVARCVDDRSLDEAGSVAASRAERCGASCCSTEDECALERRNKHGCQLFGFLTGDAGGVKMVAGGLDPGVERVARRDSERFAGVGNLACDGPDWAGVAEVGFLQHGRRADEHVGVGDSSVDEDHAARRRGDRGVVRRREVRT